MSTSFGTDRPLLYNVEPWARLGFAVPAFGKKIGTLSLPIKHLADEIGKIQLYVMTHVDAMREQPPGPNTVARLTKMINRIKSVLATRQKTESEERLEPLHATPNQRIWMVHPVPYFETELTRNWWLQEYNDLCMTALTNMYQHSDNLLSMTITEAFARDIWQYFREIEFLLATQLLRIPVAEVKAPEFMITAQHLAAYKPSEVTVNTEAGDPGPGAAIWGLPTEDDLAPLRKGIPANLIIPNLRQYPIGPVPGLEGFAGLDESATVAKDAGSGPAAGGGAGTIGPPIL